MKYISKYQAKEIELRYLTVIDELLHIQATCRGYTNDTQSEKIQSALEIIEKCRKADFEDNDLDMLFVLSK